MPCPPHPIELREMSVSRQCSTVREKAIAIKTTLKFFEEISLAIDLVELKAANQQLHEQLQTKILAKKNLAKDYPTPNYLDLKPAFKLRPSEKALCKADEMMDKFEKKMSKYYAKYEVDLCIFRDLLIKIEPYLTLVKLSTEAKAALIREKKEQLKHRKEDRVAKIKELHKKMESMKYYHSQRTINPDIEAIKEQIARIESLSNEELLSDRYLF